MRRWLLALCMVAAATLAACERSAGGNEANATATNETVVAGDVTVCGATGTPMTPADCDTAQQWIDQARQGSASFNIPKKMVEGQTTTLILALGTAAPANQTNEAQGNATPGETNAPGEANAPGETNAANETNALLSNATSGATNEVKRVEERSFAAPGAPSPQDIHNSAAKANPAGSVLDYSPLVGRRMAADLSGDAFDIQQTSDRVQTISDSGTTYWVWRVTPKATGTHTLILKTAVSMLDTRNNEISLSPTEYTESVKVGVGPATILDWINELIDWLKDLKNLVAATAGLVVVVGGLWYALRHFGQKPPAADGKNGEG